MKPDTLTQPIRYEISFKESCIIFPTASKSVDLIGLTAKKLVFLNIYQSDKDVNEEMGIHEDANSRG